jgi:phage shock protein PspC (stress-responsive transcriptional regulator)
MTLQKSFGWDRFIVRFIFAIVVVFATYNPEGHSYFHWIYEDLPAFSVLKAFIGVVLLICWIILIRATLGSLGAIGIILAAAFFGLAIWLIIDVFGLSTDSFRVIAYIISIMLASVLSIGISWSHVRRRLSGQVDTDEVERDL